MSDLFSVLDPDHRGLAAHLAARYGTLTTFDFEDAAQTTLEVYAWALGEATRTGESVVDIWKASVSESVRQVHYENRTQYSISFHTYRRVTEALRRFEFNIGAARHYLAHEAPPGKGLTPATFDDLWAAIRHDMVRLDKTPELYDTLSREDRGYGSVEDEDYTDYLLSLLRTDVERDVMIRLYGLKGQRELTGAETAAALGLDAPAVSRIRSRCLARLQIQAEELQ